MTTMGPWLRGVLDAYDIPVKAVAERSGTHESTLSRFINSSKPLTERQLCKVCIAVGEIKERRQREGSA